MAGDWLKVEKDTPEKPEVLAIAERLGITAEEAFGRCFKVWRWADSQTKDGFLTRISSTAVDSIAGLPNFADALREVGWLQARDGSLVIPNFLRHMGQAAKRRAEDALRKRETRANVCDLSAKSPQPSSLLCIGDSQEKTSNGVLGGAGGENARPPPAFDLSPAGLAQEWCFLLTRQRIGAPKDLEADMVPEFAELLRLGYPAEQISAALRDQARDRGEHFWQFKERLKKAKAGYRSHETEAEKRERIKRERAERTKEPPAPEVATLAARLKMPRKE